MLSMGVTIPYTVIPGYDPGSLSKMGNQYIRIRKTMHLHGCYFLFFLKMRLRMRIIYLEFENKEWYNKGNIKCCVDR